MLEQVREGSNIICSSSGICHIVASDTIVIVKNWTHDEEEWVCVYTLRYYQSASTTDWNKPGKNLDNEARP
jgi:hypothetical protein